MPMVGFKDDEATIIKYLKDDEATIIKYLKEVNKSLEVIPIIGMAGLGKTALAWEIFHSPDMLVEFPIRIWINISQNFNRRDVYLQILKKFISSQDMFNVDDHELAQTVREFLAREKFLLVLDDVWSVDVWNEIKQVLPLENGKSKVLITSRVFHAEMSFDVKTQPHQLRHLDAGESWTLLQHELLRKLDMEFHWRLRELDGISKKISLQCGGVPLIIAVIADILIHRDLIVEQVFDALQSEKESLTAVMKLSYNTLPYDQRYCFAYMGIFPEDYEVPVQMLLGLWIAEGYIRSENHVNTLEDIGEAILYKLIRRKLLKAVRTNHMGKVKTCRVHDAARAFCISEFKKQNLLGERQTSNVENLRRLCLRSDDLSEFLNGRSNYPRLRSLLCLYKQPSLHISAIPDSFPPTLRILESKSVMFANFPADVTKLIHLRYLTLFIEALTLIPESISLLWNLQTLVVDTKTRSITMKADIWRMKQLRHLKARAAIIIDLNTQWYGRKGKNLQTLDRLSPQSCTIFVARRAENLRTLGISGNLANIFKQKFLENLFRLEKLKLVHSLAYELASKRKLLDLPQSNCFPPNLKRLTLTNTFIEWNHMSTLANIATLEALKLKDNAFVGPYWTAEKDHFPRLQFLLIVNADFIFWEASKGSFPMLSHLVLKNCKNLDEIPEGLARTLQKLDIVRLGRSAVDSARKIAVQKWDQYGRRLTLNIGPGCL